MPAIYIIAIITVIGIIVAGLIGGIMSDGQTNGEHMPSIISRIIDWMF